MTETASGLVTVLRHGEVDGPANVLRGHSATPLSSKGWRQMEEGVARLMSPPFCAISTSPLLRCHAFGEAMAERHSLSAQVVPGLAEMNFGAWEGMTPEAAAKRDPEIFARFRADPTGSACPGGESYAAFRSRVLQTFNLWQESLAIHRLVITHAGVMRVLLTEILGLPAANASRIALAPAACFRVSLMAGEPPCLLFLDGACAT